MLRANRSRRVELDAIRNYPGAVRKVPSQGHLGRVGLDIVINVNDGARVPRRVLAGRVLDGACHAVADFEATRPGLLLLRLASEGKAKVARCGDVAAEAGFRLCL